MKRLILTPVGVESLRTVSIGTPRRYGRTDVEIDHDTAFTVDQDVYDNP